MNPSDKDHAAPRKEAARPAPINRSEYDQLIAEATERPAGKAPATRKRRSRGAAVPASAPARSRAPAARAKSSSGNQIAGLLRRKTVAAALALIVINLLIMGYFSAQSDKGLGMEQADQQLQHVYGEDYQVLAALAKLSGPQASYRGTDDPAFLAAVDECNAAFEKVTGQSDQSFDYDPRRFRINGRELYYTSH